MLSNSALGTYTYPAPSEPAPACAAHRRPAQPTPTTPTATRSRDGDRSLRLGRREPAARRSPAGQRHLRLRAGRHAAEEDDRRRAPRSISAPTSSGRRPASGPNTCTPTRCGSAAPTTTWLHRDHSQSIRLRTNAAGALIEAAALRALRRRQPPAALTISKGYIGESTIRRPGCIYLNARYLDPILGALPLARRLGPDPAGRRHQPLRLCRERPDQQERPERALRSGGCGGLCSVSALRCRDRLGGWGGLQLAVAPALRDLFEQPESLHLQLLLQGGSRGQRRRRESFIEVEGHSIGSYNMVKSITRNTSLQAHHIIQHWAVKGLPGYTRGAAPTISLEGPSYNRATQHGRATLAQVGGRRGKLADEFVRGLHALEAAMISQVAVRAAMDVAARHFYEDLNFTPETRTRTVPGESLADPGEAAAKSDIQGGLW